MFGAVGAHLAHGAHPQEKKPTKNKRVKQINTF